MKLFYASAFLLLTTFAQARDYNVSVRGVSAGKASLSIEENNAHYKVQLTLYPNMMAKMFDIDDMREIAEGQVVKGNFVSKHYKREELSGKQLLSVKISNGKAFIDKKGEKKKLSLNKKAQDPLTQVIQIQKDLKAGSLAWGYYTVTDKAQYYSMAKKKGNRVDLIRSKKEGDIISLWFDKDYELTRMRKTSNGKVKFDMKQR